MGNNFHFRKKSQNITLEYKFGLFFFIEKLTLWHQCLFFSPWKKKCTREQKLKKVAVKKKSAREKRKVPQKVAVKQNFYPWTFSKNDIYVSKIKSGHENSQKEQNYGRETKMLPVNKVAKKRAKIGVHGHFLVSRGKK